MAIQTANLIPGETYQVRLKNRPRASVFVNNTAWQPMKWTGSEWESGDEKYLNFAIAAIGMRVEKKDGQAYSETEDLA